MCYRMPGQEVDETFYRQLKSALKSQALVLVGDFNYPDTFWKSYTAKHKQSRKFLESTGDIFLSQMVEDPARNTQGVLLGLTQQTGKGLLEV